MASARERRKTCLWLAEAASWRSGVVQRLIREHGSFEVLLDVSRVQLAASLTRGARSLAGRASESSRKAASEERLDSVAFAATMLAACDGPSASGAAGHAVAWTDAEYPPLLKQLYDPPPALFVDGLGGRDGLGMLGEVTAVAIVGARGPSPYGLEMAASIAADLVAAGVVIVSGAALGVDAAAQRAALKAGRGSRPAAACKVPVTAAVLGCGVDVIYPRSNADLFVALRHSGLIISEFVWGVPARAWRFPARNRVIAGLSQAVVIVEGSERSGALTTVDYAVEAGREVLAVPGEAGRRLSAGPHALLRQGAHLCESAGDVLATLGCEAPPALAASELDGHANTTAALVLRALGDAEQSADELAATVQCDIASMLAVLSNLELEDLVSTVGGGRYRPTRRGRAIDRA